MNELTFIETSLEMSPGIFAPHSTLIVIENIRILSHCPHGFPVGVFFWGGGEIILIRKYIDPLFKPIAIMQPVPSPQKLALYSQLYCYTTPIKSSDLFFKVFC